MRLLSLLSSVLALSSVVLASPDIVPLDSRAQAAVIRSCKPAANGQKTAAITIDDGPYIYDTDLLNLFAKYKVNATFFINVKNWGCSYDDSRIAGVRKLFAAGHEFGSHTGTHANLTTLTWDKIHAEMWQSEQYLIRVLGVNPRHFRPPYGSYNSLVLSAIAARNQTCIVWDFDSGDSVGKSAAYSEGLYKSLVTKKTPTVLALNHAFSNSTVHTVLPYALDLMSKAGYKFVTVSQCLGDKPYQWTQPQGKKDTTWKC